MGTLKGGSRKAYSVFVREQWLAGNRVHSASLLVKRASWKLYWIITSKQRQLGPSSICLYPSGPGLSREERLSAAQLFCIPSAYRKLAFCGTLGFPSMRLCSLAPINWPFCVCIKMNCTTWFCGDPLGQRNHNRRWLGSWSVSRHLVLDCVQWVWVPFLLQICFEFTNMAANEPDKYLGTGR